MTTSEPLTPLIAVMIAYPPEMDAIVREFDLASPRFAHQRIKGFHFCRGFVEGREVLVVETGMSLVNAAMALQLTLDRFPVTQVLAVGAGGAIDPSLRVGDVVIPERWAYHCEASFFNEDGKGGYVLPHNFRQKYCNFGMIFPKDVVATRESEEGFVHVPAFPADPGLLNAARDAIAKLGSLGDAATGHPLTAVIGGTGVSGPIFQDNAAYRDHLYKVWKARCIEMECAAYAHVCYTNRVPFLAVRAPCDLAGGQAGQNASDDHTVNSTINALRVLRAVIREIPAPPLAH